MFQPVLDATAADDEKSTRLGLLRQASSRAIDPLNVSPDEMQLLQQPTEQRGSQAVQKLVTLTLRLAQGHDASYFGTISQEQHRQLANSWEYVFAPAGSDICAAEEECAAFYIVLEGELAVLEKRVSFTEDEVVTKGKKDGGAINTSALRSTAVRAGQA